MGKGLERKMAGLPPSGPILNSKEAQNLVVITINNYKNGGGIIKLVRNNKIFYTGQSHGESNENIKYYDITTGKELLNYKPSK